MNSGGYIGIIVGILAFIVLKSSESWHTSTTPQDPGDASHRLAILLAVDFPFSGGRLAIWLTKIHKANMPYGKCFSFHWITLIRMEAYIAGKRPG
jgi:hypothetical protein